MMNGKTCGIHKLAYVLLVIGGLNWGLVGVFQYNLVSSLFGAWSWLERLIYILVGLSALAWLGICKCCMGGSGMCGGKEGERKM